MSFFDRPILLVEDSPVELDLALQAFHQHHISNPVVVCRDGEEALEYMASHTTPDDPGLPLLVLLDVGLPKVNGLGVLREFHKDPLWQQIPVVVLTTSREKQDVAAAYQMGANSYITKPADFDAFAQVINTIKNYWLLLNESPF